MRLFFLTPALIGPINDKILNVTNRQVVLIGLILLFLSCVTHITLIYFDIPRDSMPWLHICLLTLMSQGISGGHVCCSTTLHCTSNESLNSYTKVPSVISFYTWTLLPEGWGCVSRVYIYECTIIGLMNCDLGGWYRVVMMVSIQPHCTAQEKNQSQFICQSSISHIFLHMNFTSWRMMLYT